MAQQSSTPMSHEQAERLSRQLQLLLKLTAAYLGSAKIKDSTQGDQVALLHKRGFRNKELVDLFGMPKQSVNRAIKKKSRKAKKAKRK